MIVDVDIAKKKISYIKDGQLTLNMTPQYSINLICIRKGEETVC